MVIENVACTSTNLKGAYVRLLRAAARRVEARSGELDKRIRSPEPAAIPMAGVKIPRPQVAAPGALADRTKGIRRAKVAPVAHTEAMTVIPPPPATKWSKVVGRKAKKAGTTAARLGQQQQQQQQQPRIGLQTAGSKGLCVLPARPGVPPKKEERKKLKLAGRQRGLPWPSPW